MAVGLDSGPRGSEKSRNGRSAFPHSGVHGGNAMRFLAYVGLFLCCAVVVRSAQLGERPAIEHHVDQVDIDNGTMQFEEMFELGQLLFDARFNRLDGQGRPGTTGGMDPREPNQPDFIRTSGPDSNSCAGCHAQPRSGGAGDFVANVFVLAQNLDPVTTSIDSNFSNERNTLGMMGAGPIEMLAREMSEELIAIRESARDEAAATGQSVTRELVAKGVHFGRITVLPDGLIDPTEIEGVDWDLIVKPFHQKGAVVSLREFSNNAMNHHHGMQSAERFGLDTDPDGDGVMNELSVGDITAVTIFQAALNTPGQRIPAEFQAECEEGKELFVQVGCAECHIPALTLNSRFFTEPNPFNPPGNMQVDDAPDVFSFDMTADGPAPRLESSPSGGAIVRAFTDLKRHNLNDDELDFFANELIPQGKLNGFAPESEFTIPAPPRPTDQFLTRKLWDVGNTSPYGHRGDLTLISDAIFFHGGDARDSRDAYYALDELDQAKIVEYLKTLQVVPDGSPLVAIVDMGDDSMNGGARDVRLCGVMGFLPLASMAGFLPLMRLRIRQRRCTVTK
jgi:cytochrome c peroxidase